MGTVDLRRLPLRGSFLVFIGRNVFLLPLVRYLNMRVSKLRIELGILLVYDLVDDTPHGVLSGSQILHDWLLGNFQKD